MFVWVDVAEFLKILVCVRIQTVRIIIMNLCRVIAWMACIMISIQKLSGFSLK
jgi:NADH:ubiquinone oxidoreductase subunit D